MYFILKTENGELAEYDSIGDYKMTMLDAEAWSAKNDNGNSVFSAYVFKVLSGGTLTIVHIV